jgi:Tfp pilus assembly protein PilX
MTSQESQSGAVSLFVVIFASLLITIVTVSFVQLMLRDQQQSTISDLSRSASDSALAGVEDAKRLLLLDQACKDGLAAASVNCTAINAALTPLAGTNETACSTLADAGIVGMTGSETIIEQSTGDGSSKLDQAYTCVKVVVNTDDVKKPLEVNRSLLIPITGVGAFDSIELSWFNSANMPQPSDNAITFPSSGGDVSLPRVGTRWESDTPPLLRTQLIQLGSSFSLSDFNDSQPGNKSNANTLFLYPSELGVETKDFALDGRRNSANTPQQAKCNKDFSDAEYICKATITLPQPITGDASSRNAYLRLTALYNNANVAIRLKNGASYVRFNGVQPEVDSTGRANDVFRRVKARVELTGNFPYPEFAIDMNGSLCKNFTVTDTEAGYSPSSSCIP